MVSVRPSNTNVKITSCLSGATGNCTEEVLVAVEKSFVTPETVIFVNVVSRSVLESDLNLILTKLLSVTMQSGSFKQPASR